LKNFGSKILSEKFKKFHPELIAEANHINIKDILEKIRNNDVNNKQAETAYLKLSRYMAKQCIDYLNDDIKSIDDLLRSFASDPLLKVQGEIILGDLPSFAFFAVIAAYQQAKNPHIYVIQEDFFRKFKEMNLDKVQWQHIPKKLTGFVQLPHVLSDGTSANDKFDSFYFYCGPGNEIEKKGFIIDRKGMPDGYQYTDTVLCLGYTDTKEESSNFCFRSFPKDLTLSVKDSFANVGFLENDGIGGTKKVVHEQGYHHHYAVMINLLAYLKSGDPDLREFRNTLRYRGNSTTKVVREDAEFSHAGIMLVGFNYMKESLKRAGGWSSVGHFGWRWVGVGRTELKLSYVSGSNKKWHDKPEESKE